ncbi:MAG: ATP-binding protein [Streptosporangiaceae bacterium]
MEDARALCLQTMQAWSLQDAEERVTAIVTELVANAVSHAGTPLGLRLLHVDSMIRIEVSDGDPTLPVRGDPAFLDENGRGMVIIESYSSDWGASATPEGKVVWAEIDLSAR